MEDIECINFQDYHLHNLINYGVCVFGENPEYNDLKNLKENRYKRFNFTYEKSRFDTFFSYEKDTPYLWKNNKLYFKKQKIQNFIIKKIDKKDDIWGSESAWYFKKNNTGNPFYELRLNPINFCYNLRYSTGPNLEFKGCSFCHRMYNASRNSESRKIYSVQNIFKEIFSSFGSKVIIKIEKVLVITGDSSSENSFIKILEEIYFKYLKPYGFEGTFSVATTLFRTEKIIKRLSKIDNSIFEFPLEIFTRRKELLGPRKGCSIEEVKKILSIARKYFIFIRLNYLIGIDSLEEMEKGFSELKRYNLVDDVIANNFTPFSKKMKIIKIPEAYSLEYLILARNILKKYDLQTRRPGVTKNIFFEKENNKYGKDLFISKKFKMGKKTEKRWATWVMTHGCNANPYCPYCIQGINKPEHPNKEITKLICKKLNKLKGDWIVSLIGGEIFDMPEFISVFFPLMVFSTTHLFSLATNLKAPIEDYLKFYDIGENRIVETRFSYHPLLWESPVAFLEKLQKVILHKSSKNVVIKVAIPLLPTKLNVIKDELIPALNKIGIPYFCQILKKRDKNTKDVELYNYTKEQKKIVNSLLYKEKKCFKNVVSNNFKGKHCMAGVKMLSILETGNVYRCMDFSDFPEKKEGFIGNICDNDFILPKKSVICPFPICTPGCATYHNLIID